MPHRSAAQMYRAARKSDALLTGAPLPTLFYFALPIILGNIFQQLYSIVDAIVVGKFLGDLPLAGISVAAPIVDVANALVIGGTIGIGVLCAQMCGAEDWTRLRCMNATAPPSSEQHSASATTRPAVCFFFGCVCSGCCGIW